MTGRRVRVRRIAGFVAIASIPAWVAVAHRADASDGCRDLGSFVNGGPTVTWAVSAPHGAAVDWSTWDGYVGRETITQGSERVRLDMLDGAVVVASWTTADLADRVRDARATGSTVVRDPFTSVRVTHQSDGTSPNSLRARVCVTPNGPPATTSTTVASTTTTSAVELIPPQTVEATDTTVPTTVPTTVAPTVETPTATPTVASPSYTG